MTKVLVLYHSSYGHLETMAEAVAEGARSAGAEAVEGGNGGHQFHGGRRVHGAGAAVGQTRGHAALGIHHQKRHGVARHLGACQRGVDFGGQGLGAGGGTQKHGPQAESSPGCATGIRGKEATKMHAGIIRPAPAGIIQG